MIKTSLLLATLFCGLAQAQVIARHVGTSHAGDAFGEESIQILSYVDQYSSTRYVFLSHLLSDETGAYDEYIGDSKGYTSEELGQLPEQIQMHYLARSTGIALGSMYFGAYANDKAGQFNQAINQEKYLISQNQALVDRNKAAQRYETFVRVEKQPIKVIPKATVSQSRTAVVSPQQAQKARNLEQYYKSLRGSKQSLASPYINYLKKTTQSKSVQAQVAGNPNVAKYDLLYYTRGSLGAEEVAYANSAISRSEGLIARLKNTSKFWEAAVATAGVTCITAITAMVFNHFIPEVMTGEKVTSFASLQNTTLLIENEAEVIRFRDELARELSLINP